jgi:hypothetical protein
LTESARHEIDLLSKTILGEIGICASNKKVLHSLIKVAAQLGQVYRTRRVYKNSNVEGLKN